MLSIEPITLPITIDAMSSQRIPFQMHTVWTIGPKNDPDALGNFARLMMEKEKSGVVQVITGVVQGETRVLAANMTSDELFEGREKFKTEVTQHIQKVLDPFGLKVYNSNQSDLDDKDRDNQYFAEQKRRALQHVSQQARIATAESIAAGTQGEAIHQSTARQAVARADTEARLVENERAREVAESMKSLSVAQATYKRDVELARIQAEAAAEEQKWLLQMQVEQRRKEQEIEKKRADSLTTTTVAAEIAIKQAEGNAASLKIEADGKATAAKAEAHGRANALTIDAEAQAVKTRLAAEAALYAAEHEARGIVAIRQAEADGLQKLIAGAGGDVDALNRYMMVREGVLQELAKQQANSLQNLRPNISVWSTNNGESTLGGGGSLLGQTMVDLVKTGMPLFDGIKQQTGYDFLGKIQRAQRQQQQPAQTAEKE